MRVLARIDDTYDCGQVFGCYKLNNFQPLVISKLIEYSDIWCSDYLVLTLMSNNNILLTKRFSLENFDYSESSIESCQLFLDEAEEEFKEIKEIYKE